MPHRRREALAGIRSCTIPSHVLSVSPSNAPWGFAREQLHVSRGPGQPSKREVPAARECGPDMFVPRLVDI